MNRSYGTWCRQDQGPIREGLVAMGASNWYADYVLTSLVLMVTGVWDSGIEMAYSWPHMLLKSSPRVGPYLLLAGVLCLSFSSMLGFSYYVVKCGCFLWTKGKAPNAWFYLLTIVSAVVKMDVIINFLDIALAWWQSHNPFKYPSRSQSKPSCQRIF